LYDVLGDSAQRGWDQVRPLGTVDARIVYKGPAGGGEAAKDEKPATYEMLITPRSLTATPAAAPYRLENLAGSATITSNKVVLSDVTARHGDANVHLSGQG